MKAFCELWTGTARTIGRSMSNPSQETPKARILALVEDQPEDSSYDEILHELAFVRMVERGIADADAGRVVSHEEVRRRLDTWSR